MCATHPCTPSFWGVCDATHPCTSSFWSARDVEALWIWIGNRVVYLSMSCAIHNLDAQWLHSDCHVPVRNLFETKIVKEKSLMENNTRWCSTSKSSKACFNLTNDSSSSSLFFRRHWNLASSHNFFFVQKSWHFYTITSVNLWSDCMSNLIPNFSLNQKWWGFFLEAAICKSRLLKMAATVTTVEFGAIHCSAGGKFWSLSVQLFEQVQKINKALCDACFKKNDDFFTFRRNFWFFSFLSLLIGNDILHY